MNKIEQSLWTFHEHGEQRPSIVAVVQIVGILVDHCLEFGGTNFQEYWNVPLWPGFSCPGELSNCSPIIMHEVVRSVAATYIIC